MHGSDHGIIIFVILHLVEDRFSCVRLLKLKGLDALHMSTTRLHISSNKKKVQKLMFVLCTWIMRSTLGEKTLQARIEQLQKFASISKPWKQLLHYISQLQLVISNYTCWIKKLGISPEISHLQMMMLNLGFTIERIEKRLENSKIEVACWFFF